MNYFVVHDPKTGAIKRSGHCTLAADLPRQALVGEAVLKTSAFADMRKFAVDVTKNPPVLITKATST